MGNPFSSFQHAMEDMGDMILGPIKDIMIMGGLASGLLTFMTTYHRKAIASGARAVGSYAISSAQQGIKYAPLLL